MSKEENLEQNNVQIFKRGSDDINLNDYLNSARAQLDFELANSTLNKDQKKLVVKAYQELVDGIQSGTISYKLSGGFNTKGIVNRSDGLDDYGLAAGVLGRTLRKMDTYTPPKQKTQLDSTKIRYEGAKTIGNRILEQLLGEARNLQYFINQDTLIDGKRGQSERIKLLQEQINNIAAEGYWDKYFTGHTDQQKEDWFRDYEKYGKNIDINGNGIIDESEYLGLSKLLGLNNIESLFFTGDILSKESTDNTSVNAPTYTSEEEYLSKVHPRTEQTLAPPKIIVSDKHNYDQNYRQQFISKLNLFSADKLIKVIQKALSTPLNARINTGVAGLPQVTNNYVLCSALEIARRRNLLHQFPTDPNKYYIPIKSKTLEDKGIGIVYQIDINGKNTILEMDKYDIPYFTTQWHNDFMSQIPAHKSGGTIKKLQGGGWFEDLYKQKSLTNWNDKLSNVNWNRGTTFHGKAGDLSSVAAANTAYTNDYDAVGQDINTFVNTFNENLTPEQIVEEYNKNAAEIRSMWDGTRGNIDYRTTDAQSHNQLFAKMFANRSKVNGGNGNYNLSYQNNLEKQAGSQTWHRRMDRYEKEYDQLSDEEKKARTYTITRIINGKPQVFEVYKKANGDIGLVNDLLDIKEQLANDINPIPNKIGPKPEDTPEEHVEENSLPLPKEELKPNIRGELLTGALNAGRLLYSLRANRKIADRIRQSLNPVLKDPYELYSPVTGAFSLMQAKNRQGASTLYQAAKPFTSDAYLNAARMMEGQRAMNQLQTEGFLADDQEIKRTQAEALARREKGIINRNEVTNFNRASINQNEREKAQLDASKLKSDWQSWDNAAKDAIQQVLANMKERNMLSDNLRQQISQDMANNWKTQAMKAANTEMEQWIAKNTVNDITPDITKWPKYQQYKDRENLVNEMYKALLYKDLSSIYRLNYKSPYTDDAYKNFLRWV